MAKSASRPESRHKRAWENKFLESLAAYGVVVEAAKAAGIHFTTAYKARENDPEFGAAWESALEQNTQRLEREAFRRAAEGTERPVYYRGEEVGRVREYSDSLLMFLLKARREIYRQPLPPDAGAVLGELIRNAIRGDIGTRKDAGEPPQQPGETGPGGPTPGVADAAAPRED